MGERLGSPYPRLFQGERGQRAPSQQFPALSRSLCQTNVGYHARSAKKEDNSDPL
jgi:hypothetical protein